VSLLFAALTNGERRVTDIKRATVVRMSHRMTMEGNGARMATTYPPCSVCDAPTDSTLGLDSPFPPYAMPLCRECGEGIRRRGMRLRTRQDVLDARRVHQSG
jgi:hypothetical protein